MRPLIPIIICFFLFCLACKKSDRGSGVDYGQGVGNCRIIGFHDELYFDRTFEFQYNADNKLSRIRYLYGSVFGEFTRFSYDGNRIIVTQVDSAGTSVAYQDTVYTNEFGLIDSVIHESGHTKYYYNQLHQLVSTVEKSQPYVCQFFWDANGNMTSRNTDQGVYNFSYFPTQGSQFGDCQKLLNFLDYGAVCNTSHWLTRYSEYNDRGYHNYTFDADGKILTDSCRHISSDPTPYTVRTFQYECN